MGDFTIQETRTAKARGHRCGECRRLIGRGDTYRHSRGIHNAQWWSAKQCEQCGVLIRAVWSIEAAMDIPADEHTPYGRLADTLTDWALPEGHISAAVGALFLLQWAATTPAEVADMLGQTVPAAPAAPTCPTRHTELPAGYVDAGKVHERLVEDGWTVEQCPTCAQWVNWTRPPAEVTADV